MKCFLTKIERIDNHEGQNYCGEQAGQAPFLLDSQGHRQAVSFLEKKKKKRFRFLLQGALHQRGTELQAMESQPKIGQDYYHFAYLHEVFLEGKHWSLCKYSLILHSVSHPKTILRTFSIVQWPVGAYFGEDKN